MKQILIINFLFTIGTSFLAAQSTLNCEKFRNGTFKIEAGTTSKETRIMRNGDRQVETTEGVDGFSEFFVKWLSDCTYTLTPTKKTFERFPALPENAVLTVKIIKVKENAYIQTSSSNFSDYVLTSEVIRVK